jgi:hypothetical protein
MVPPWDQLRSGRVSANVVAPASCTVSSPPISWPRLRRRPFHFRGRMAGAVRHARRPGRDDLTAPRSSAPTRTSSSAASVARPPDDRRQEMRQIVKAFIACVGRHRVVDRGRHRASREASRELHGPSATSRRHADRRHRDRTDVLERRVQQVLEAADRLLEHLRRGDVAGASVAALGQEVGPVVELVKVVADLVPDVGDDALADDGRTDRRGRLRGLARAARVRRRDLRQQPLADAPARSEIVCHRDAQCVGDRGWACVSQRAA